MESMTVPWMAEVVLISWRTVRRHGRPPLPSELLATFVAFGTFSVIGNKQPRVASALGWGIVVATFLNLFPEGIVPKGGKVPFTTQDPAKPSNTSNNANFMGPVLNRTSPTSFTTSPKGNVA